MLHKSLGSRASSARANTGPGTASEYNHSITFLTASRDAHVRLLNTPPDDVIDWSEVIAPGRMVVVVALGWCVRAAY
jgi:hypothetical protein